MGGLKPWRSRLVQSLFAPVYFEFIRSPTHHFPSRRSAIRSKKRRIGAKDGGLGSVQDCRAICIKKSRIGDNTRVSTHPPYAPEPARAYCREGEQIPAEKNLPKLDDFHHPILRLGCNPPTLRFQTRPLQIAKIWNKSRRNFQHAVGGIFVTQEVVCVVRRSVRLTDRRSIRTLPPPPAQFESGMSGRNRPR